MTNAASTPDVQSSGALDVAPRLGHLLEEYGEITAILPVLAGLFVTSRLQLRGAQALLANLAIAALTRQAIVQLKKYSPATAAVTAEVNGQSHSATATAPTEDYTIVHSTSGRLRLRVPRVLNDAIYAKRLEKLLSADDRVTGIRLNRAAASLVILYDGAGVSELELGMRLLQILDRAQQDVQPESTDANPESV